jgi:hypothetical protein
MRAESRKEFLALMRSFGGSNPRTSEPDISGHEIQTQPDLCRGDRVQHLASGAGRRSSGHLPFPLQIIMRSSKIIRAYDNITYFLITLYK